MFVGFNIRDISSCLVEKYYETGQKIFEDNKSSISSLEKYEIEQDSLNADDIMNDWFPQVDAHVFLSHSHKDKKLAQSFAGWLKEYAGINAFIDSCVWGYCDDLIKIFDEKYNASKDEEITNDIRKHVYLMLNAALMKMIDNTECFMFINTSNSLIQRDEMLGKQMTYSPWIYSEICATNFIRRRTKEEHRSNTLMHGEIPSTTFKNQYSVDINRLVDFDEKDFKNWSDIIKKGKDMYGDSWEGEWALDALYKSLIEK